MNASVKTLIKITLSLGLLAFIFYTADVSDTFQQLSSANLWFIPIGVGIYLISQWVSSYRWQFLSKPLGFDLSTREFFDYYMIGMYLNLFLPGSIGGDVGRVYYLAKSSNRRKREALLTLLAERGVGLIALLFITGMVCLTPQAEPIPLPIRFGVLGLSTMLFIGFIALHWIPLDPLIKRFPRLELLQQANVYWKDIPLLIKSVAISVFVHSFMVAIHAMIAHALGLEINLIYLIAVYGLVTLLSVTPIFFNGIGLREGGYQYMLGLIGISASAGLAFGLYWFLISTLTSLTGGLVFIKGHYKTPTADEAVIN